MPANYPTSSVAQLEAANLRDAADTAPISVHSTSSALTASSASTAVTTPSVSPNKALPPALPVTPRAWAHLKTRHHAPDESLGESRGRKKLSHRDSGGTGGSNAGDQAAGSNITHTKNAALSHAEARLYGRPKAKRSASQAAKRKPSLASRSSVSPRCVSGGTNPSRASPSPPTSSREKQHGLGSPSNNTPAGRPRGASMVVNEMSLSAIPALEEISNSSMHDNTDDSMNRDNDHGTTRDEILREYPVAVSPRGAPSSLTPSLCSSPRVAARGRGIGEGTTPRRGYTSFRNADGSFRRGERLRDAANGGGQGRNGGEPTGRKSNNTSAVLFPTAGVGSAAEEERWRARVARQGSAKSSASRRTSVASEGGLIWKRSPSPEHMTQSRRQPTISHPQRGRTSPRKSSRTSSAKRSSHAGQGRQSTRHSTRIQEASVRGWESGEPATVSNRVGGPRANLPDALTGEAAGIGPTHGEHLVPLDGYRIQAPPEEPQGAGAVPHMYADANFAQSVDDVLLKYALTDKDVSMPVNASTAARRASKMGSTMEYNVGNGVSRDGDGGGGGGGGVGLGPTGSRRHTSTSTAPPSPAYYKDSNPCDRPLPCFGAPPASASQPWTSLPRDGDSVYEPYASTDAHSPRTLPDDDSGHRDSTKTMAYPFHAVPHPPPTRQIGDKRGAGTQSTVLPAASGRTNYIAPAAAIVEYFSPLVDAQEVRFAPRRFREHGLNGDAGPFSQAALSEAPAAPSKKRAPPPAKESLRPTPATALHSPQGPSRAARHTNRVANPPHTRHTSVLADIYGGTSLTRPSVAQDHLRDRPHEQPRKKDGRAAPPKSHKTRTNLAKKRATPKAKAAVKTTTSTQRAAMAALDADQYEHLFTRHGFWGEATHRTQV